MGPSLLPPVVFVKSHEAFSKVLSRGSERTSWAKLLKCQTYHFVFRHNPLPVHIRSGKFQFSAYLQAKETRCVPLPSRLRVINSERVGAGYFLIRKKAPWKLPSLYRPIIYCKSCAALYNTTIRYVTNQIAFGEMNTKEGPKAPSQCLSRPPHPYPVGFWITPAAGRSLRSPFSPRFIKPPRLA